MSLKDAELLHTLLEFFFYLRNRAGFLVFGDDILFCGVDEEVVERLNPLARYLVNLGDSLDFVAEELHSDYIVHVARNQVDGVAFCAETSRGKFEVVSLEEDVDKAREEFPALYSVADVDLEAHELEVFGVAGAVNRRDRGDDYDIAPREQGCRCRKPHLLDFGVDLRVFLDIDVPLRNIGFRLVIVVVGNEVFHAVIREEVPEFVEELRRKSLVMRQHKGGFVARGYDVGDGKRLSRAGYPEKRPAPEISLSAFHEFLYGFRLRSFRLKIAYQFKRDIDSLHFGSAISVCFLPS